MWVFPALSTAAAAALAAQLFRQWRERGKRPHHLFWGIGMVLYALGTASEFRSALAGWDAGAYRLWYLCGAVLVAATLGQGTVYLHLPREAAHAASALLLAGGFYATLRVFTAPLDFSAMPGPGEVSGEALPAAVRALTPWFNVYGTIALVGGAVASAVQFATTRRNPRRLAANILIAVGVLAIAASGAATKAGDREILLVGEFVGLAAVYAGFLLSR